VVDRDDQVRRLARWPVRSRPRVRWAEQEPTVGDADPALIAAALKRAQARPAGNWFAVAASRDVRADRPAGLRVLGRELVLWRGGSGAVVAGPGACPHLGAPLAGGRVECGDLVCRWHGLRLPPEGGAGWRPLPCHDDGLLVWVRLDLAGEEPLPRPVLPARPRPARGVAAVIRAVGICAPEDVIANRLDPWHGAWFHPYAFSRLRVVQAPPPGDGDGRFLVEVTYRVGPRLGVPVLAEFTSPDLRTVVMRIVDGEGVGSVVETHATPLGPGHDGRPRTAVIEAAIATSDRPGFAVARLASPVLRPMMRRAARRLWRDDLAYAERRYALRAAPP
jgi:nitrite reductase/ring-hydroxylating ferredoxin subunit